MPNGDVKMNNHTVFRIGCDLAFYELDQEHVESLGQQLIEMSGICLNCRGTGIDGDPPDPAGDGGWEGPCIDCGGTGMRKAGKA